MTHKELEGRLRERLARRAAPDGFAERVIAAAAGTAGTAAAPRAKTPGWRRPLAIAAMLAVTVGGGLKWRQEMEERERRGEEAKRQLFLALKITSEKLGVVQTALDRSTH